MANFHNNIIALEGNVIKQLIADNACDNDDVVYINGSLHGGKKSCRGSLASIHGRVIAIGQLFSV
uniref:Uncharacterized protein n=1 Tax=Arion vulgaris TaxID=1028688 RepID=A0A0B7AVC9_9EUPU